MTHRSRVLAVYLLRTLCPVSNVPHDFGVSSISAHIFAATTGMSDFVLELNGVSITSNNAHATAFVLIPTSEECCYDQAEAKLMLKARFRNRARREKHVLIRGSEGTADMTTSSAAASNMSRHGNKFGTPLPTRRSSLESESFGSDASPMRRLAHARQDAKNIGASKSERASHDSIMVSYIE